MAEKIKTVKSTFEIEEWVQTRLKDRNRLKGYSIDSFVNEAIMEKILRSPDRSEQDRPSTGSVKVNTRLEWFVNEKLKNKDNLGHRTKESYINEAVIEKLSRDNFLAKTQEKFDIFLNRATHIITDAVNSSDFAELMTDFNNRLKNITPGFDSIELKAIETDLRFGKKELSDKIKIIYLVANDKDLPSQFVDSYLVKDLISEGYLDLVDHQLSISESLLDRFDS